MTNTNNPALDELLPDEIWVDINGNATRTQFKGGTKYTRSQPSGDAVKALDAFNKWMGLEFSHFDNTKKAQAERDLAYYASVVRAALTQPSGDAVKQDDALKALDRLENDALASRDGYGDARKDAETIRAALTQAPKVDVEGLIKDVCIAYQNDNQTHKQSTVEWVIKHLAAQGYIGVPEWQPIETAPKPVGHEELWILGSDGTDVRTTRWCTEYPTTRGVWFLNYEPTDYIPNINYWNPTKWMPLLAAPKKEG